MRFARESALVGVALIAFTVAACGATTIAETGQGPRVDSETSSASKPKKRPSIETTPVPSVSGKWSPSSGDKTVYLTFDDGPGPNTGDVLDVLKENDVKATFLIIGKMIRTREADLKRVYAEGHATGNHTWDHANLAQMNKTQVDRQLNRSALEIGPRMGPCMRPPYGALDGEARKLSVAYGMTPVLWTRDTNDWNKSASQASIGNVLKGIQPGDIVLMHDGGGDRKNTVNALREVLPTLKAKGYKFDVVPVCRPLGQE